jgi:hypothetical protein
MPPIDCQGHNGCHELAMANAAVPGRQHRRNTEEAAGIDPLQTGI